MRQDEHWADRPMPGYKPLGGRRRALIVVFVAVIIVDLLAVGSSLMELDLLDRLEAGEAVTPSEIDDSDTRQGSIGVTQVALFIAGVVVFIRWLRAAYRNTDHVAPGVRRFGHGWAIGAWFVPILNLWRPKQIVNDVWRAGGNRKLPAVLNFWWAAWLLHFLMAQFATRGGFGDETFAEIRASDRFFVATDLLNAIAAVLAVMVVVRITARLDTVARLVPTGGPPAPSWDDDASELLPTALKD